MEITKENISDVLKDPVFISDILPSITQSEGVQTLITNKATTEYQTKITEEVSKIHGAYDNDMFEILGVRPEIVDGKKVKTYDAIKTLYGELKGLRGQKDSLNKEAKVIELNTEIERLKAEGGGSHVQKIFDAAKLVWDGEKSTFEETITGLNESGITFQKKTTIGDAFKGLKFNPDVSDAIRKMIVENVEKQMIANSELKDGKLIFMDSEGKPIIDPTSHTPKTAEQMLASNDAIKEISLTKENTRGGGADSKMEGSIQTTKIDGKDQKSLILPEGIKTKMEFSEVSEKALVASGITISNPLWDELKNKAYKELGIAKLPIQ